MPSFSTALSALNADTTAIDVVGNNLANLNTPDSKPSTVSFYDLVTQSIGAGLGATQVGFGVGTPVTLADSRRARSNRPADRWTRRFRATDFSSSAPPTGNTEYTRGGSFQVKRQGDLTTSTGELVQGWTMADGVLDTNQPIGNITVPSGALARPRRPRTTVGEL